MGKKKMEFSKKIFLGIAIGVAGITIFACVMSWRTNDTSVLSYLITGMFAELATATAFYYNKAKAENIRKIEGNPNYGYEKEENIDG